MMHSPPPGTSRYFIALIPPSPIFEEALTLKEYFKEEYHSKAALNSPPHITLHMPFQWKEVKEEKLISALQAFCVNQKPFPVSLNDFACFEPRVIYIHIKPSEFLTALQHELFRYCKIELNLFNAQYRDLPFHPHITLAFRDLKRDQFQKAWQEFKEKKFSAEFTADKITLLKHDGKHWKSFHDFHF